MLWARKVCAISGAGIVGSIVIGGVDMTSLTGVSPTAAAASGGSDP